MGMQSKDDKRDGGSSEPAPLLRHEPERLQALRDSGLLSSPPSEALRQLTDMTASLFHVPMALVSLVGKDRQHFFCSVGLPIQETHRDESFCAHALHESEPFVVLNTLMDVRFASNPLVTGALNIRFYAGAPIFLKGEHALGTLCILDTSPRSTFKMAERHLLQRLAGIASCILNDSVALAGHLSSSQHEASPVDLEGPVAVAFGPRPPTGSTE